jgi:hypothetical protein
MGTRIGRVLVAGRLLTHAADREDTRSFGVAVPLLQGHARAGIG